MAGNRVSLGIDADSAIAQLDGFPDAVDDGASAAVKQLAVLAEASMKDEAPEGDSTPHLRDTIDTRFRRGGKAANVGARKKTDDGGRLADVIVDGTDPSSYTATPGLVAFLGKQMEDWADAKLGDESAAYQVAWSIARTGHTTLPNDFVNRSLDDWEDRVEEVTGEKVRDAMSELMRGG
jgi:hypothetical protein